MMEPDQKEQSLPSGHTLRPIWSVVFSIFTILFGFMVIGPVIGMLAGVIFYPGSLTQFAGEFSNGIQLKELLRTPLMVMQGFVTAVGLLVMPWLFLRYLERIRVAGLFTPVTWIALGLTAVSVVLFMLPNSVLIEWNSNLTFPGEWDTLIRDREEDAAALTRFLTTFPDFGQFLFGLLIVAVLPALGEEMAFRGMLQPAVARLTGNPHAAIWITAILFSALHMQFLGFVPRVMLGALFGYLAVWSGSLWLPVAAHLVNNGLSVILLYLNQTGLTGLNPETTESAPWAFVIPGAVLLVLVLGFLRKKLLSSRENQPEPVQ